MTYSRFWSWKHIKLTDQLKSRGYYILAEEDSDLIAVRSFCRSVDEEIRHSFNLPSLVVRSACHFVDNDWLFNIEYSRDLLCTTIGATFQMIRWQNQIDWYPWMEKSYLDLNLLEILNVIYDHKGFPRDHKDRLDAVRVLINSKITQFCKVIWLN